MVTMWQKFKSFYNKDDIDISTGHVDPFKFHLIFYKVFVAFNVADLKNKNPPSIFNQNAVIFIFGCMALVITSIACSHGLKTFDLPLVTESGTYSFILVYLLLIIYTTRHDLEQYHNLLHSLKEDFHYICTVGEKYRTRYFENQITTWKICIIGCIFTCSIPIGMVIVATLCLLYFVATYNEEVGGSRPLLFPFWMPNVDFSKSPIYELAFMFANICVLLYGYNYLFMSQTQIVWVRQITSKVDLIIWSLQDLLVGVYPATTKRERLYYSYLIDSRMREIIIHHQSMYSLMQDYATVYKKMLMYEQMVCGPVVCLTAYCFAEKIDQGEFQGILLLLCIATIVLPLLPSYLCTFLASKVNSICDACWNIPFWNANPVIRPYMVLIMQRSQRPLPLQAPGFEDVSIETYSKKMTSAYSLFNMLRQTNL